MEEYFRGFQISTGTVRDRERAYLLATKHSLLERQIPHTRIFTRRRGSWGSFDLHDRTLYSASVCFKPAERFVAIGEAGTGQPTRARLIGGGEVTDEVIEDGENSPARRGPLREVRGIAGGRAYAVGTCRQVYRRDVAGIWTCIDQTARTPIGKITDSCFESVDGFSETDIYAVGWGGEMWHFDGQKWTALASLTNLDLHKVRCAGDGKVYACGQVGTVLRGRGSLWEIVEQDVTKQDFWGLEWFGGVLYLCTTRFVFRLEDDHVVQIDFDGEPPETCYHLSAADGRMWSIGARDVMEFDGQEWASILHIESDE